MKLNKDFDENWKTVSDENKKINKETDDRIWKKISEEIELKNKSNFNWLRIAAVILPLLVVLYYFINFSKQSGNIQQNELYYETTTFVKTFQLSDGSKIKLDPNSKLTINNDFGVKNRTISIKGSGYFDIAKDKTKPFNVITNGFKVQVLGTKFYLNQSESESKVDLLEGKVSINYNNQHIILLPNEIWINNSSHKNYHYLKPIAKSKYSFENKTYDEVIKQLEKRYNTEIKYPIQFKDNKINGEFEGNLEDILTIVSYPFNLKIEKTKEHKIRLK
ncbi:MAG: FecR family protein [Empedobacter falsenii]|uniref:FecR family protein n=1 Tax=unclassified Empedobacter TaxID=2643773 RepID=UPI0025C0BE54|nr:MULTISPECIES: FecR family protein [unclassified Empedobacter]